MSVDDLVRAMLRANAVDAAMVSRAREKHREQIDDTLTFMEVLLEVSGLSEGAYARLAAQECAVPIVRIPSFDLSQPLLATVPAEIAALHGVLPIHLEKRRENRGILHLAMINPADDEAVRRIASLTNFEVRRAIAAPSAIRAAIEDCYVQTLVNITSDPDDTIELEIEDSLPPPATRAPATAHGHDEPEDTIRGRLLTLDDGPEILLGGLDIPASIDPSDLGPRATPSSTSVLEADVPLKTLPDLAQDFELELNIDESGVHATGLQEGLTAMGPDAMKSWQTEDPWHGLSSAPPPPSPSSASIEAQSNPENNVHRRPTPPPPRRPTPPPMRRLSPAAGRPAIRRDTSPGRKVFRVPPPPVETPEGTPAASPSSEPCGTEGVRAALLLAILAVERVTVSVKSAGDSTQLVDGTPLGFRTGTDGRERLVLQCGSEAQRLILLDRINNVSPAS